MKNVTNPPGETTLLYLALSGLYKYLYTNKDKPQTLDHDTSQWKLLSGALLTHIHS